MEDDRAARAHRDRRLLERAREGDTAARDEVVERFLPLARKLARRYQRRSEPLDDLYQVASLGLLKAIDRFDVDRGLAFTSFAVPTILGELKRYFRDKTWSIRVPRGLQELAIRIDRIADEMSSDLGRSPTPTEIAEKTGVSLEDILEARAALEAHQPASLDRPRSAEDGDGEAVIDAFGHEDPGYEAAEASAMLDGMMRSLSGREREILRLRFHEDLTQSEIGRRLGISQMHVSRLIRQSIAHLQDDASSIEQRQ